MNKTNDVIAERLKELRQTMPASVRLLAVSKYYPQESIARAYEAGQRLFGESRVQELCPKEEALPKDIEWHFIGTLQTNKVKYIAPFISMIHSVDSLRLLQEINKAAEKNNRIINCLLEVHVAKESSKHGFSVEELMIFMSEKSWLLLSHIRICGLMGMATDTDDKKQISKEFSTLSALFSEIKSSYFSEEDSFNEISMGMSSDYQLAIEQGSTMVRVGSALFG